MKDNEIIKALECCMVGGACEDCPYCTNEQYTCGAHLDKDAHDLINRQQSEIEDLKKIKENSLEIISIGENQILEIREKSIKEFAKRLKNKWKLLFIAYPQIGESIDNLVKEMVGDAE